MTSSTTMLAELSCSERLTIWTIRRLLGRQPPPKPQVGQLLPYFYKDFEDVTLAFSRALERVRSISSDRLDVGIVGTDLLTQTEACLLDATSAAQTGEESDVRSALRRVFSHHHVLAPFAAAVTLLGACLASAGHWLPRRRSTDRQTISATEEAIPLRLRKTRATPPKGSPAAAEIRDISSTDNSNTQLLSAGCLNAVTRWHDLDMGMLHVMWPRLEDLDAAH